METKNEKENKQEMVTTFQKINIFLQDNTNMRVIKRIIKRG